MDKYYCKEPNCHKEISYNSVHYGSGKCKSCAHKGIKHTEESKEKIRNSDYHKNLEGENNHNWKEKVEIECIECGKKIKVPPYLKEKKFCSKPCANKWKSENSKGNKNANSDNKWTKAQKERQSILTKKAMDRPEIKKRMRDNHVDVSGDKNVMFGVHRFGEDAPGFIDGRTPLVFSIRNLEEYKIWRNKIFKRDNYLCQKCGIKASGQLEAHHIKHFAEILSEFLREYNQFSPIEDKETLIRLALSWKPFWEIDNGQTLCKDCHNITKSKVCV